MRGSTNGIYFHDCRHFLVLECSRLASAQGQPDPRSCSCHLGRSESSPELAIPSPSLLAQSQLDSQFQMGTG